MNVWTIIPGRLYIRGDMRSVKRETKLAALRELGIDTVVCLICKIDPDLVGVEGIEYIHWPLSDGLEVDTGRAYAIRDKVLVRLYAGRTVLLHCIVGKNRSGLVASLVVSVFLGVTAKSALEMVRRGRPGAVTNPVFERYLEEGIGRLNEGT